MADAPKLWTTAEFAAFAQISLDHARKLRQTDAGPPYVKVGARVRYVPASIHRWVLSNQHTTTREATR